MLLRRAATAYRSELLATAASATMGSDAVEDVVAALQNLVKRLDEEQEMEGEHRTWCETEMSGTTQKKAKHVALVEELTQTIADTTEVINEKTQLIADNAEAVKTADAQFKEQTQLR